MVKDINKDIEFLSQKSSPFIIGEDDNILQDMFDTAESYKETCVGLACIQIGIPKRVILVKQGNTFVPFINPMIIKKSPRTYVATEGCLSIDGEREVTRHFSIKVTWTTPAGKRQVKEFSGFTAQIIQHEVDHCNGIII